MLPLQQKRIRDQLIRWGYSRFAIERMKPIQMTSCYFAEVSKRSNKTASGRLVELSHSNMGYKKIQRKI